MSCGKIGSLHSRSRSQQRLKNVSECLLGWCLLNCRNYQTWYGDAALWTRVSCRKKKVCYPQCQGHIKGSYGQNMTFSAISSELLIPWQLHHHKPECPVKKKLDCCILSQGHSKGSKCQCLPRWYLLSCQTFCYQLGVFCDASSWAGVSCKKIGLLFSRSRSQQGLICSKYDSFYYIFWTVDPFATKMGLVVHYHKPKCLMEKLECCVQGQGHHKISKCHWMFVQMISSESLNLLLPSLVLWWIIIKDWSGVFRVKVTVKDHNYNKYKTFWYIFLTDDLFSTKLDLMAHHHKLEKMDRSVLVKVTEKVQNSSQCSSGWYFSTAEPSVMKLGMVVHHHGPECHVRRLVCCLQVQGHSDGS